MQIIPINAAEKIETDTAAGKESERKNKQKGGVLLPLLFALMQILYESIYYF